MQTFMKIRPVESEWFLAAETRTNGRAGGWTDGHDEANSRLVVFSILRTHL
jgi:hypothetical protein